MGNILYIAAAILIFFWLIGFFAFKMEGFIHVLLVTAAISIVWRLLEAKKMAED